MIILFERLHQNIWCYHRKDGNSAWLEFAHRHKVANSIKSFTLSKVDQRLYCLSYSTRLYVFEQGKYDNMIEHAVSAEVCTTLG